MAKDIVAVQAIRYNRLTRLETIVILLGLIINLIVFPSPLPLLSLRCHSLSINWEATTAPSSVFS